MIHTEDEHRPYPDDNLPRLLFDLACFLQTETLQKLEKNIAYSGLKLSFEAYIALISPAGTRQKDIARTLGISKQSCNQTSNQLEQAGYLQRTNDPLDGRGKLLRLTAKGSQLRHDGSLSIARLEQQLIKIVGKQRIAQAKTALLALCTHFNINLNGYEANMSFSGMIFRVNDYVMRELLTKLMEKHPQLKPSHRQVLSQIEPNGTSIQTIANINKVSKQAISGIASQLEKLAYISKFSNTNDKRKIQLAFTEQGKLLMEESAYASDCLVAQFEQRLGKTALAEFENTLLQLVEGLGLSRNLSSGSNSDISNLSSKLITELGSEQAKLLATTLLQELQFNAK